MNIVFMSMDTLPSTLWARDLYDQIPKMQRLTEPQFKGLELEWHRPEDDAGK